MVDRYSTYVPPRVPASRLSLSVVSVCVSGLADLPLPAACGCVLGVCQIGVNSLCTYDYDRHRPALLAAAAPSAMHLCSCNLMFLTVLLPVVVFIVSLLVHRTIRRESRDWSLSLSLSLRTAYDLVRTYMYIASNLVRRYIYTYTTAITYERRIRTLPPTWDIGMR